MKRMTLDEIHLTLLDIAKEFDRICVKHNIPYYMIGGTMLGAVRHKGFIPWDDDMDFGVPVEYYEELQWILNKELPSFYRCSTYKNSDSVFLPFFKIEDTSTILDDKQIPLPLNKKIGVNIDIFPLYMTNMSDINIVKSRKYYRLGAKIYTNSRSNYKIVKIIKQLLRILCPVSQRWFCDRSIKCASRILSGPYLSNIWGRWEEKEFCPPDWYGMNVRYPFENITLIGIKENDFYLSQMYGQYMRLPKDSERFTHSAIAYKK